MKRGNTFISAGSNYFLRFFHGEGWLKSFQLPISLKQFPAEWQLNARYVCLSALEAEASVPMGVCGAPFAWPSSALDRQYLSKQKVYHWIGKACQESCEDYWPATVREKGVVFLAGKTWAQGKSTRKQLSNEAELPISTKELNPNLTGIKPKPFFTPPASQGCYGQVTSGETV